MEQFRRFAVAMECVAIAVLAQETHKAIGLACWRLANHVGASAEQFGLEAGRRETWSRQLAQKLGEHATCIQRSRWLLQSSRALLADRLSPVEPVTDIVALASSMNH